MLDTNSGDESAAHNTIIPQDAGEAQTGTREHTPTSPDEQPAWMTKLSERGILEAVRSAGGEYFEWYRQPGFTYPLADPAGKILISPDGRPAQRFKNLDSSAKDKYKVGYPGRRKGMVQPKGCDIYCVPGINLAQEIARALGVLIIACGEPDMWTFISVGRGNVLSFFGEGNIPADIVERLKALVVLEVWYYADRDATGRSAALSLTKRLAGSGIRLRLFELPEEVNGAAIKDINDLYRALGCNPKRFLKELKKLKNFVPGDEPPSTGSSNRKPRNKSAAGANYPDLPPQFCADLELKLGVKAYRRDGWSNYFACPFQHHEHDDRHPKAHYHRDKHILYCFKCGGDFRRAKDVAAALGLDLRDYYQNESGRSVSRSGGSGRDGGTPADGGECEPRVSTRLTKPTDDELGSEVIADHQGDLAFIREAFYTYGSGVWGKVENIDLDFWRVQQNHKPAISPTASKARSIRTYVQNELFVPAHLVDQGLEYVNLPSGMFNLKTYELEEHRRDLYFTWQLAFSYDAAATCPTWERCLQQWVTHPDGTPDIESIKVLQEGAGYSLTTDTSFETAFLLVGPAASGKSTYIKTLQRLFGPLHLSMDFITIDKNTYQWADLLGKRLVTSTEYRAGMRLLDDLFKQLVSGEQRPVRQIYGKNMPLEPYATLWLAMNELPIVNDRSDGVFRRMKVLKFLNGFPLEKRDRHLFPKLMNELPGIFNWQIEGLKRLYTNGAFTVAAQIRQAVDDYRLANDIERQFVEECCDIGPGFKVSARPLHRAYEAWCIAHGYTPKAENQVGAEWQRLGFQKGDDRSGNYYVGLRLK